MISIEDLVELSGLSLEEIEELAKSHHEPVALSVAHGECLLENEEGILKIKKQLKEKIKDAVQEGDKQHLKDLIRVYKTFHASHPSCKTCDKD